MNRKQFITNTGLAGAGLLLNKFSFATLPVEFPIVRVAEGKRHFTSVAVEKAIAEFSAKVKDKELAWLFHNCFPNTLDTTVYHKVTDGRPDTYVITGDIDAMWLRDSSAQVWPYLTLMKGDAPLQQLIAGAINRQTTCVLKDPYANAFYSDDNKRGEWKSDRTDMKPGVHERKWEIDSLCYPIRLAYAYWKQTGDATPFDAGWKEAVALTLKTFREQQCKGGDGPYRFQRTTANATDTRSMAGYGYPVKPVGLISSAFRPSDDATVFSFLIPSNFFAVVSLRQAAEMVNALHRDEKLAADLASLEKEVTAALSKYATVMHARYGNVYAFEVDGFGSHLIMDDANVPSLISLPYLGAMKVTDPVYVNTRKLLLSSDNPFFYKGTAAEGIGGPHVGKDMIWPMSLVMRGLTSVSDAEIKACIKSLKATHAGTGFMHEGFHKDDPKKFTRSWFAWANTIFGEFIWKVYREKPHLLSA
ncbi:MAG TPA: glycoside hydrolase family 125 protein [Flavisolibacter sp.]|nr:glycoside hydrolase family 125 protein [Flavisolibacter sp.]